MVLQSKKVNASLRALTSDITEVQRAVEDIKEKIKLIVMELKICAKYDEVKVLESYISLWEPIKYVTEKEVESIVRHMLETR